MKSSSRFGILVMLVFLVLMLFMFTGCDDESSSDSNAGDESSSDSNAGSTTVSGKYSIVDTNQSDCYDSDTGAKVNCTGKGYDADYAGNQPAYTKNADGTVTDGVTGLTWTQSPDINGDGQVNSSDKKTQSESVSYCENLSLGGYGDWRLPDIKTLYSLMDFTGVDPSGYSGSDTSGLVVFIPDAFEKAFGDMTAGERLIDGQYATTSIYVYYTNLGNGQSETMFGVNFVDGRIKGYPTGNKTYYVHCVRGNEEYGKNSFSDNGDDTVSDTATGLMWQKKDFQSQNFDDALAVCESASTGGHSDWRLPNIKELHSITDYSRSPDISDSAALDSVFDTTSFTNEDGKKDWGYYWSSTTHASYNMDATEIFGSSGAYVSFGRALGYIDGIVYDVHGAGAQRSNYKNDVSKTPGAQYSGSFYYFGPQGDILRADNMVRCVRNI